MIRNSKRVWDFLWRYSFFRWGTFNLPAGIANYAVAFLLFSYYGVDKYVATLVGHSIQVTLAFFYDRDITHRAETKRGWRAFGIYWFNDIMSLGSIMLTIYLLVDYYQVHLVLMQYTNWSYEKTVALVRAVPAMIIGTAISYGLNKVWTFNETNSQHTLP